MPLIYIPRPDAGVRDWTRNFAALIFAARLTTALEPSTHTTVAVAAKNASRATMLRSLRGHAPSIRVNRGVADADNVALGLAPLHSPRTPTPAPRLQEIVPPSGVHTLRFADELAPTRRCKPRGVAGPQLFVSSSPTPPPGPESAEFRRFLTCQDALIHHTPAARGRTVCYWARWQTRRGYMGPWSPVTAATVVA